MSIIHKIKIVTDGLNKLNVAPSESDTSHYIYYLADYNKYGLDNYQRTYTSFLIRDYQMDYDNQVNTLLEHISRKPLINIKRSFVEAKRHVHKT